MTRKILFGFFGFALLLLGCGGLTIIVPSPTPEPTATTTEPLPSPTQPPTITPIAFPTYTATPIPSETPLPTVTLPATLTLEPQWYLQGPGQIIVPILLYHHIGYSLRGDTTYYVSPDLFDKQLNLLYQWGYRTISVEQLVKAVQEGAELPSKPIILTFDDGSETIYENALSLMRRYKFTGISYIVYNYIGTSNYMNADQLRTLNAAGWDIGSHSLSHKDLTTDPGRQMDEIVDSRRRLEALLGLPVLSFAYPFGAYDSDSLHYVHQAGYIAAMGPRKQITAGQ